MQPERPPTRTPKVALLIHQLWPINVPLWEVVEKEVGDLIVFASVLKEPNRNWEPDFGSLTVQIQRTLTISCRWKHPRGFADYNFLHLPVDTYGKLRRYRPNVIISSQLGFRSLIAWIYKTLNSDVRLVLFLQMTEHQQKGAGCIRKMLRTFLLAHADWAIVNGKSALQVINLLGFPRDRATLVPNVCELRTFFQIEPQQLWNTVRKLVFVGRLVEAKGLLTLLRALDQVVSSDPEITVKMTFVGSGPLAQELSRAKVCSRLKVEVRGSVPEPQRHRAFAHGQVFVFPTFSDEWGLVVNEAMAAGLAVCGSVYSQAVVELVEPGRCGWHVDPFDFPAMCKTLLAVLSTPGRIVTAMGQNAREKIRTFTPALAGERIVGAIADVLVCESASRRLESETAPNGEATHIEPRIGPC